MRNQQPTPPAPTHRGDLGEIPEEFRMSVGEAPECFLIYENGPQNPDRILAFATKKGLNHLYGWKMATKIFNQVYCIRVPFHDNTITAVYALLANKTRVCYEELLQAVVDKCQEMQLEINVTTVVSDFEDAVLRAILAVIGRDVNSRGYSWSVTITITHLCGVCIDCAKTLYQEGNLF